ncbi:hypothetical protein NLG97_g5606 [Lecanicillium saksenae]|uniref:Uncharacterized protein n=1 Tax=Lecanicillium saksenae TaxID=468837 RepID=A0ACC1QV64_9HYPO|nr:hypothetical protein NLG97_g5606 [Lecanicillium saksenae]
MNPAADAVASGLLSESCIWLFGSLAYSFEDAAFKDLCSKIHENESNSWLLECISNLPKLYEQANSEMGLQDTTADAGTVLSTLVDVVNCFATAHGAVELNFPLQSTVLIPLAIVSQLADFSMLFTQRRGSPDSQTTEWHRETNGKEVMGLCTGILSALAVASSQSFDEFKQHAMAAVHIDLYGAFHASSNEDLVNRLIAFCASHGDFQLPNASKLNIQVRSGVSSGKEHGIVTAEDGPLHAYALKCILQDRCHWFDTFSATLQEHESKVDNKTAQNIKLLVFGPNSSVPSSLLPKITLLRAGVRTRNVGGNDRQPAGVGKRPWAATDIAVVGMACKVAGADDIDEFWDLLVEGTSQHQDLADSSRIPFQNARSRAKGNASLEQRRWFANLIRGHDEFDHRFFKKTARESAAMDPQQRQLLQIAYQAVQQSSYFGTPTAERESHVGCFVGVCQTDYENNIACHPPGSFTATGNLRGFLAGKVSHYFGWTGPGLAIDTACSSSLVAVHQACNSILSGECSMALACGSHVITCPDMFQNLAAAQFLSPTGQCKPFDAKADGYCRGEGVGAVFLKRLDTALADKDQILGVIAGTAVQQNQNCTPLFVPNGPSLSNLFERVLKKADTRPEHVSVVEAHGTGTAVGDPAEYGSIRQVLGGERRAGDRSNLLVTSVKGLVGHLECTSGIISLIKVLLMMRNNAVPPQASFTEASPALLAKSTDHMQVPTSLHPWDADFKIALVNNYGASGSNAAAVVMQPPKPVDLHPRTRLPGGDNAPRDGIMYPFWISAHDEDSIRRYAGALKKLVVDSSATRQPPTVATISFSLEHQSNRDLQCGLLFKAGSAKELEMRLTDVENYTSEATASELTSVRPPTTERPRVVLCFGGQVSTFIGIDRGVYENVAIFRKHLHDVDEAIQGHDGGSIFPSVFQRTPIADTVVLQTALFATQYACAKSWMDCGIQPVSIVGHSFGELTALCVSEVLSLEDTVKMIVRRATAVRDHWGPDPGSMVAVDGELGDVAALLTQVNRRSGELRGTPASIACYNGPRSFTLAGPARAMEEVVTKLRHTVEGSAVKSKQLNVTNSFHCALVDPILDHLHEVGRDLTFHQPSIHVESATESAAPLQFKASFVADHMRKPVYFDHAVRRISEQFSSSSSPLVFLEAGTNSGITSLAARVLRESAVDRSYGFHGLDLCKEGSGWNSLVKTTQALWESGIDCKFWAHHKFQRENHDDPGYLLLPPYQFNPHSHWLDLKQREELDSERNSTQRQDDSLIQIVSQNSAAGTMEAQFHVNTQHTTYLEMLSGHNTIRAAPICPAAMQIGLVSQAFSILHPDYHATETVPHARSIEYHSPICPNSNTQLWIHVSARSNEPEAEWNFTIFSAAGADGDRSVHTIGCLSFVRPSNMALQAQLETFSRLVRHDRVVEMLESTLANDVLGPRAIYKLFADVVDYSMKYQGIQKLACFERESAARIIRKELTSTTFISSLRDAYLSDAFFQPGGVCVNCLADGAADSVYLAHKIQQWIQQPMRTSSKEFHAFTSHSKISSDQWLTDVFVFDAADGSLVQVILGLSFVKIPRAAMQRTLARMSNIPTSVRQAAPQNIDTTATSTASRGACKTSSVPLPATPKERADAREKAPSTSFKSTGPDISAVFAQLRTIASELMGAPEDRIRDNDSLLDLGVDSLTGMELINEIESSFQVRLPTTTVLSLSDFASLAQSVAGAIGQQQPAQSQNSTHEHEASPGRTEDEASDGTGNDCLTSGPNTPRTSAQRPPPGARMAKKNRK